MEVIPLYYRGGLVKLGQLRLENVIFDEIRHESDVKNQLQLVFEQSRLVGNWSSCQLPHFLVKRLDWTGL